MTDFGIQLAVEDSIPEFVTVENKKSSMLYDWQRRAINFFFDNNYTALYNVCTGCLTDDTLVEMPRDLNKYPKGIPIKDLLGKKDFYVYSFNTVLERLELKKCVDVFLTENDADVYEIITKQGKIIKATKNHMFLTCKHINALQKGRRIESREYKELKDLKIGEHITTFSRGLVPNNVGPLIKVDYNKRKRVIEHRFIVEQMQRPLTCFECVHHIDGNHQNNSVDNLLIMNSREHNRLHTLARKFYGKALWKNGEHPKGMLNKHHNKETRMLIGKNSQLAMKGLGYDSHKKEETLTAFKKIGYEVYKSADYVSRGKDKMKKSLYARGKDFLFNRSSVNSTKRYFDKIEKINYIGKMPVYDLTVEDNHNFIANNMIVHNSGKTRMAIEIIKKLIEQDKDCKVLIVVPKNVILETGWYKELFDNGISLAKVGVYYGRTKEYGQITITNMQSLKNVYLEYFNCLILDECITGDSKVMVFRAIKKGYCDYRYISIKELVENRRRYKVASYNIDKKNIEIKSIEKWFKSEEPREIYDIELENGKKLSLTGNHQVYTNEGYKCVSDLKGDEMVYYIEKTKYKGLFKKIISNNNIKQVILNSFIGDGSCRVDPSGKSAQSRFSGIKKDYILYKKNILESGGESVRFRYEDNSKGFNKEGKIYRIYTKSCSDILDVYRQYQEKGIDYILDNLTDLGIALWMFDDGSNARGMGFVLHCNRFCQHDVERICNFFNNRQLFCKVRYYIKKDGRGFYCLYFNKKGLRKLLPIMKKHCVPSMEYKTLWK